ncbi:MAG: hypothetical protein HYZ45_12645, partial [Burkholderiales bacterium]|nr:hypothetical protein [Burkholderiales bacterium]
MKNMRKALTSTRSQSTKESTGVDRLYKRTGVKKVSFYYQHTDKTNETLASAPVGDKRAIAEAERTAKRKAMDIQQGKVIANSIADLIDRFKEEAAPVHYKDQSKEGLDNRNYMYVNLKKFFGQMHPQSLEMIHGYQYLEARKNAGAPALANKEIAIFSTICNYAIRWGIIKTNPLTGIMQNKTERVVRTIYRQQIVRFYLWSLKQDTTTRNLG